MSTVLKRSDAFTPRLANASGRAPHRRAISNVQHVSRSSKRGLGEELVDRALADESTWQAVVKDHSFLVERTRSFGVPTIVLDGGDGPAIFGPVISELPSDEEAIELWRHVSWLARYENFSELKRGRSVPVDLPAAAWRRAEREKGASRNGSRRARRVNRSVASRAGFARQGTRIDDWCSTS